MTTKPHRYVASSLVVCWTAHVHEKMHLKAFVLMLEKDSRIKTQNRRLKTQNELMSAKDNRPAAVVCGTLCGAPPITQPQVCSAKERHIWITCSIWIAILLRGLPIVGFSMLLILFPEQYGLMFTTVLIYILYFIVFGYIGRHQRKKIGHAKVGLAHGIFLSFAFAATNPIFAI